MGSQSVEFSSRTAERRAAVVNPIAANDLPTAILTPVWVRAKIPNPFLVNHTVPKHRV